MEIEDETRRILERYNLHLIQDGNTIRIREDDTNLLRRIFTCLNRIVEETHEDPRRMHQLPRSAKIFMKVLFKMICEAAKITGTGAIYTAKGTLYMSQHHPKLTQSIIISAVAIGLYFKISKMGEDLSKHVIQVVTEKVDEASRQITTATKEVKKQYSTVKTAASYESKALVIRDLETCINENMKSLYADFEQVKTSDALPSIRNYLGLPSTQATSKEIVTSSNLRELSQQICAVQREGVVSSRLPLDIKDRSLDPQTFSRVVQTRDTINSVGHMTSNLLVPVFSASAFTIVLAIGVYFIKSAMDKNHARQAQDRAVIEDLNRTDQERVREAQGETQGDRERQERTRLLVQQARQNIAERINRNRNLNIAQ